MITAIIVDDEVHAIDRLKNLLETHCPEIELLAACTDIEAAFQQINLLKPQVVFLDVQIHNSTGFDLLKRFSNIDFSVIFKTAYEKYAIQAFRFGAVDYLLKPIDPDELAIAVKKLKEKQAKDRMYENLEIIAQNMLHFKMRDKKITIPTLYGMEMLNIQEILYLQSDINYTTLFLKNNRKMVVAKTLKEFEGILIPYNFFRLHNSYLVNLSYAKSYIKGKGGSVKLEDGTEIEVSVRRKEEFLKRLAEM
jgi:two-component system LytT family response regulator